MLKKKAKQTRQSTTSGSSTKKSSSQSSSQGKTNTQLSYDSEDISIALWSVEHVASWLMKNNLGQYVETFKANKIDGEVLLSLEEDDLKSPLLGIKVLGDLKRMLYQLKELKEEALIDGYYMSNIRYATNSHWKSDAFWKLLASFIYMCVVSFCTAITMAIVHDRVPEQDTYPPLPDIFLDNIQLIPFAFELAEIIILLLGSTFIIILLFHRHRIVILRRFFAISATVFLLRCFTMFVTSLSVPGDHLKCDVRVGSSVEEKVIYALKIIKGGALSINGLRTCGDYMFSGHTVILTLVNFFVSEYTPQRYEGIRIATWVLNFFGMFFVLAAHEHYSIDVTIAFYISSRLFTHYHDLANSVTPTTRTVFRRSFIPLFEYFEEYTNGAVPNEYEWPWEPITNWIKRLLRNKKKEA